MSRRKRQVALWGLRLTCLMFVVTVLSLSLCWYQLRVGAGVRKRKSKCLSHIGVCALHRALRLPRNSSPVNSLLRHMDENRSVSLIRVQKAGQVTWGTDRSSL